jgi:NitT/TauT family transport system permease protein
MTSTIDMTLTGKKSLTTMFSLILYLCLWKVLSLVIGRSIILPSPEEVLIQTIVFLGRPESWKMIAASTIRGMSGFFISLILGIVTGFFSGKSRFFQWFTDPFLISIRSIPVLSLILLAIIWFPTEIVPVFICFLVVYPVVASGVAAGVRQVDTELLEMAFVYNKSSYTILKEITLPSILPYLFNGISTGLGLTWKSVVAAEILSMPREGLGTAMQTAQLQLDTDQLFSWTLIVVLLAGLSEFLVQRLEVQQ